MVSPSPPVAQETSRLIWDFDQGAKTFGDAALVQGIGFAPGRYTLWIGPPRAGTPTCVPADAVALETVTVAADGAFAHGFTLRESWGNGWRLRPNDFFRLYAAPGGDRCLAAGPPAVVAVPLRDHGTSVHIRDFGACPTDRQGPTSVDGNITNFYAPSEARRLEPVVVVVRVLLAETCTVACPNTLRAVVDESTRTVSLEIATFRAESLGCLGSGSEADLETTFVPASTGVYQVRASIAVVSYAGGSRQHLTIRSPAPDAGFDSDYRFEATLPVNVR